MKFFKITTFVVAILLLCVAAWFFSANSNNTTKSTLLIQAISDSQSLNTIKDTVTSSINNIIKEELGLDKNYDFEFFIPKQLNRLTLYYVQDIMKKGEEDLFSALTFLNTSEAPDAAVITADARLFGEQQDELVIIIADPVKELAGLNTEIKTAVHQVQQQYKRQHNLDLYNRTKSEQFPYLPHIGLGRVRLSSIQEHIKDAAQVDEIVNRIRERIIKLTQEVIVKTITDENNRLDFNKVSILNLQKKDYVKEYKFKS
jgi:hypothetical protein